MATLKKNFEIGPLTSFKIGGKVSYFVETSKKQEVKKVFNDIEKSNLPFVMLGGGTNVLFSSQGFKGWVVKLNLCGIKVEGNLVKAEAGVAWAELIKICLKNDLAPIHKLIGIPGTVGGAIRGNAGAYGAQVSDFIEKVEVYNLKEEQYEIIKKKDCGFDYRKSIFSLNKDLIILAAEFKLEKGDPLKIKEELAQILEKRKEKPYGSHPSAGSIFKNVSVKEIESPGLREKIIIKFLKDTTAMDSLDDPWRISEVTSLPAGYLIEEVNLRGMKVGQAQISQNHGNVIVNLGGASSNEVMILISMIKTRVRDELGVPLKEEIVYVQ